MVTVTKTALATSLALTIGLLLTACSGGGTGEPAGPPTPSESPGDSAEPTPSDTADSEDTTLSPEPSAEPAPDPTPDPDALPPGFPDPATLIGQPAHDERSADGSRHTVIAGTPLELVLGFGACFDGGTGDVCGYAISSSVPGGSRGAPADAALLLLLSATGNNADGTATWEILDAIVTRPPDGAPAFLDVCEGAPGVAIYPESGAAAGDTIPVAAAWGPNADVSALVEVDPASITCAYVGV